jgi:hypothetical protein
MYWLFGWLMGVALMSSLLCSVLQLSDSPKALLTPAAQGRPARTHPSPQAKQRTAKYWPGAFAPLRINFHVTTRERVHVTSRSSSSICPSMSSYRALPTSIYPVYHVFPTRHLHPVYLTISTIAPQAQPSIDAQVYSSQTHLSPPKNWDRERQCTSIRLFTTPTPQHPSQPHGSHLQPAVHTSPAHHA